MQAEKEDRKEHECVDEDDDVGNSCIEDVSYACL